MRNRRMCYHALVENGYANPSLFFERKGKLYMSYWGSGERRMEVFCDARKGEVQIFELRFIKP